jgi:hypothetical protein
MKKVGLLCGREWSFPAAFLEEVNGRDAGVLAELVKLGGSRMNEPCPYAVLVDRVSHEVPYYRSYLKNALVQGSHVVNNPFVWSADDRFLDATLAARLGVPHPKTVVLPNKDYLPGIGSGETLRNLVYPLDWEGILDHVGLPCILKNAHGGGWKHVAVCCSLEELWQHYNTSGLLTMVVQEYVRWDHYVRCLAVGRREVLPMGYDPTQRRYLPDEVLPEVVRTQVEGDTLKLAVALGYDLCSADWGVRDGVPYAIDFLNPVPDLEASSLTPSYFRWAVEHTADMVLSQALDSPSQLRELRWSEWF